MAKFLICFLFAVAVNCAFGEECPGGGEIYVRGVTKEGQNDVVNAHNQYRQMIMAGTVPGQPKGKNLKTMKYDSKLGTEGVNVSNTCKMHHIQAQDGRWNWVGQNLYISWSSVKITKQDWKSAVSAWFSEHKDFTYPSTSRGITGHYTQVVWADSEFLGCDFIAFYDKSQPSYPYARLYTCNYGPGGNISNRPPYPKA